MTRKLKVYLNLIMGPIILLCLSSCHDNTSGQLLEVDKSIRDSDKYISKVINKADSLSLDKIGTNDSLSLLNKQLLIADAWGSLDLNKSLKYLKIADSIAFRLPDVDQKTNVSLRLASLYNSQGSMLEEAYDIFRNLNPSQMPDSLKTRYYILGVQIYRSLGEKAFDEDLKKKYFSLASNLRDSVLSRQPENVIISVNKLIEGKRYDDALALLRSNRPECEPYAREAAPFYHYMAEVFKLKNMPDSQQYYLSQSAISDLRNGVREYKALPQLAELLKNKEIQRAYDYINKSMKDAQASHSEQRMNEIAPAYREIHATYNERQKQKTSIITFISVFLLLLLVTIVLSLLSLKKKNQELKESARIINDSKNELQDINTRLKHLNEALSEQSLVKEHYVRSFMELSLSYLKQMESFRAEIAKIAAKGNWKLLTDRINSSRYINQEIQEFYHNFDIAFLSIYPDFINELNRLLKPEEQITGRDERLTTELRIYALIRLGITESNQIAKFLRCSESTVYNYRTRMRNRALNRDEFENFFLGL